MLAEINRNGVLSLFPETETELYALNHWSTTSLVNIEASNLRETCFLRGSRIQIIQPTEENEEDK